MQRKQLAYNKSHQTVWQEVVINCLHKALLSVPLLTWMEMSLC